MRKSDARNGRHLWAFVLAAGAAAALHVGAAQAWNPCWLQGQYAGRDDGDLDGGGNDAPGLRRPPSQRPTQPDTPSEDETDDTPSSREAPDEPPGCIFNKRPLELLV